MKKGYLFKKKWNMEIILINIIMYLGTYAIISPCVFFLLCKTKGIFTTKILTALFQKMKVNGGYNCQARF